MKDVTAANRGWKVTRSGVAKLLATFYTRLLGVHVSDERYYSWVSPAVS